MTQTEALAVVKNVFDAAIKAGIVPTVQDAVILHTAYTVLSETPKTK